MHVLTYTASFGALQGILLLVFITLRQRHPGNLPLALFLMVFSLRLATIPTWNYSILASHPWLYPATSPLPFLFGPLLWWYALSSGNNFQIFCIVKVIVGLPVGEGKCRPLGNGNAGHAIGRHIVYIQIDGGFLGVSVDPGYVAPCPARAARPSATWPWVRCAAGRTATATGA